LAGQAGDVWAGAADHRAFDGDGFLALARQGPGEDLPRDPAANDQVLNPLGAHDAAPFLQETSAVACSPAFQASPNVQSAIPSRARSLMRNCPGSAERAGKPPRLDSHTPGVVMRKLRVVRNIPTARALPRAAARGENGRRAIRSAMATSTTPSPAEKPRTLM